MKPEGRPDRVGGKGEAEQQGGASGPQEHGADQYPLAPGLAAGPAEPLARVPCLAAGPALPTRTCTATHIPLRCGTFEDQRTNPPAIIKTRGMIKSTSRQGMTSQQASCALIFKFKMRSLANVKFSAGVLPA